MAESGAMYGFLNIDKSCMERIGIVIYYVMESVAEDKDFMGITSRHTTTMSCVCPSVSYQ